MTLSGILAEDLFDLKSVTDPQLSPDGTYVAFVETSIDKEDEEYISNLFVHHFPTNQTTQWTFGSHRHSSPRWSPNGESLAFLSNRTGKNQLYVLQLAGGEANKLTDLENGASTPIWSPDSKSILFSTAIKSGKTLHEKIEKPKKEKKAAKIYDRIKYKADGKGYLEDTFSQLVIIDVKTGDTKQLTKGDQHYSPSSWSPDGNQIAYTGNDSADRDYQLVDDVFILDIESEKTEKITPSTGFFNDPKWSPDGTWISIIGHEREYQGATLSKIWLYNTTDQSFVCLTSEWDVQVGDVSAADFHIGTVDPGLLWTNDSQGFYFLISDHGNVSVYYGSVDGAMYPSLNGQQHVYGLTINPETHEAVLAISTPVQPGDLYTYNLSTGERAQLTFINDELLKTRSLSEAEPISFPSSDGREIHGWMMKPADFDPEKRYPLVLEIHGGPHAMYANTYFHEFQTLTAQGYTILFTNPRGSHGYGQEFVQGCVGDYGGMDYQDLMAAVDYAVNTYDFLDEQQLAVTGGSYGGFMTNWIVGHTNRFKAAVTQRCISNWLSFYGVSDIGYYFTEWEIEGDIFESPEKLWHHSPLKYAANVQTPLLLLHGELDFRCPIEQSEQFFTALKRQKKEAVLVSFPGETHEVSRSGSPRLRLQHTEQIRDWFKKYL
ncbi:S9 family peptidase [Peribacillus psychrosaccharolyticus]|uniref:S9 family peptidase n=1 Tax=Peribacillus psychrosaccharolyticus TaxID=1407 RepID=UPI003D29A110